MKSKVPTLVPHSPLPDAGPPRREPKDTGNGTVPVPRQLRCKRRSLRLGRGTWFVFLFISLGDVIVIWLSVGLSKSSDTYLGCYGEKRKEKGWEGSRVYIDSGRSFADQREAQGHSLAVISARGCEAYIPFFCSTGAWWSRPLLSEVNRGIIRPRQLDHRFISNSVTGRMAYSLFLLN